MLPSFSSATAQALVAEGHKREREKKFLHKAIQRWHAYRAPPPPPPSPSPLAIRLFLLSHVVAHWRRLVFLHHPHINDKRRRAIHVWEQVTVRKAEEHENSILASRAFRSSSLSRCLRLWRSSLVLRAARVGERREATEYQRRKNMKHVFQMWRSRLSDARLLHSRHSLADALARPIIRRRFFLRWRAFVGQAKEENKRLEKCARKLIRYRTQGIFAHWRAAVQRMRSRSSAIANISNIFIHHTLRLALARWTEFIIGQIQYESRIDAAVKHSNSLWFSRWHSSFLHHRSSSLLSRRSARALADAVRQWRTHTGHAVERDIERMKLYHIHRRNALRRALSSLESHRVARVEMRVKSCALARVASRSRLAEAFQQWRDHYQSLLNQHALMSQASRHCQRRALSALSALVHSRDQRALTAAKYAIAAKRRAINQLARHRERRRTEWAMELTRVRFYYRTLMTAALRSWRGQLSRALHDERATIGPVARMRAGRFFMAWRSTAREMASQRILHAQAAVKWARSLTRQSWGQWLRAHREAVRTRALVEANREATLGESVQHWRAWSRHRRAGRLALIDVRSVFMDRRVALLFHEWTRAYWRAVNDRQNATRAAIAQWRGWTKKTKRMRAIQRVADDHADITLLSSTFARWFRHYGIRRLRTVLHIRALDKWAQQLQQQAFHQWLTIWRQRRHHQFMLDSAAQWFKTRAHRLVCQRLIENTPIHSTDTVQSTLHDTYPSPPLSPPAAIPPVPLPPSLAAACADAAAARWRSEREGLTKFIQENRKLRKTPIAS